VVVSISGHRHSSLRGAALGVVKRLTRDPDGQRIAAATKPEQFDGVQLRNFDHGRQGS
jgi:hypothetical protein